MKSASFVRNALKHYARSFNLSSYVAKRHSHQIPENWLSALSTAWQNEHHSKKPILHSIHTLSDSTAILGLIQEKYDSIDDPQIYVKAMTQCKRKKDFDSVHNIMRLLLKSRLPLNVWSFSIFIDAMAISDKPELCIKYFKLMVHNFKIQPNVIIFSSLLKSLRLNGHYQTAEKYWKLMRKKYDLSPDEMIYTEILLVYDKLKDTNKAIDIFHEYVQSIKDGDLNPHVQTFGAYLTVFCNNGNVIEMEKAVHYVIEYGFQINRGFVTNIVRGYFNGKQYQKCVDTYEKWIATGQKAPQKMIGIKCKALNRMIESNEFNVEQKKKLLLDLESTSRKLFSYEQSKKPQENSYIAES